jgi:NADPH-dependent curcumin reductase CurA
VVRNIYLSLDPTNRGWMNAAPTYLPALALGDVMRGITIGVVEQSRNSKFEVGDLVQGLLGWQMYAISDGRGLTKFQQFPGVPLDAFLGLFGMIGLTAYFGLLDVGRPKEGETLVVSGAAGAVGSLVCQIGKIKGLRVIGIAGSDEKCSYLTDELGVDGAINYKTENVKKALRTHCPEGIDLYFDNVGGEILDTVLGQINLFARIILCGMISQYNASEPQPGPYNLVNLLVRRGRMQGFIVMDYYDRADEAMAALAQWYGAGKISYRTEIVQGLREAPQTLNRLFDGNKTGKLIVQLSDWEN